MTRRHRRADRIFYSAAAGPGQSGDLCRRQDRARRHPRRDHGLGRVQRATAEAKRPTVQVGDPFTEKLLIEACLELMAGDAIVAIQDMGAAGPHLVLGRDGRQGRARHRARPRPRAGARSRHEPLRDHALREPGAHADDPEARPRGRGAPRLREMGARFRGDRPRHRDRPAGPAHARRDRRRHAGRAAGHARRRSTTGPGRAPRAAAPRSTRPPCPRARSDRRAEDAARLPRPRLEALDLGAVRPSRAWATRCSARAATRRWCASPGRPKGAGAASTDCTPRYCHADPDTRRRAGGGRKLAQPHRGRRPAARASPTT